MAFISTHHIDITVYKTHPIFNVNVKLVNNQNSLSSFLKSQYIPFTTHPGRTGKKTQGNKTIKINIKKTLENLCPLRGAASCRSDVNGLYKSYTYLMINGGGGPSLATRRLKVNT